MKEGCSAHPGRDEGFAASPEAKASCAALLGMPCCHRRVMSGSVWENTKKSPTAMPACGPCELLLPRTNRVGSGGSHTSLAAVDDNHEVTLLSARGCSGKAFPRAAPPARIPGEDCRQPNSETICFGWVHHAHQAGFSDPLVVAHSSDTEVENLKGLQCASLLQ